jgi:hypothetical protein
MSAAVIALDELSHTLLVQSPNGYPSQGSPQSSVHSAASPQLDTARWPTAEEEKIRLFTQAQNNARIVQSYAQDLSDSRASHGRAASRDSSRSLQQGGTGGRPPVISAGAALYSHAMASVNKPGWGGPVATSPQPAPPLEPRTPPSSRLPSAAEEKEMLRRYHNATRAVQQHHEANFGSSDGIMPSAASSSLPPDSVVVPYPGDIDQSSGPASDDLPPPWVPSPEFLQTEGLSEKERYRIAFEARERAAAAAAAAAEQQPTPPHPPANSASPPADYYTATGAPYPGINDSDKPPMAADNGLPPPWQPSPPTVQSGLPSHLRARSPPVPPPSASSPRMLSAAEEKALLKAKYEAEETTSAPAPPTGETPGAREQRQATSAATSTTPQVPPPLRPRPPASYIQETAEEDARLQDELANGQLSTTTDGPTASVQASAAVGASPSAIGLGDDTFGLLRPTSPFAIGWESIAARGAGTGANAITNGFGSLPLSSPPPLPPKVPLEH